MNALANGPTLPGNVTFDVRWTPGGNSKRWLYNHESETNEPDSYALDYWDTQATLEWTAETEGGFSFESYKIGSYPQGRAPGQLFAIAGRERSGVFYQPWSLSPDNGTQAVDPTARGGLAATGSPVHLSKLGFATLIGGAVMWVVARRQSIDSNPSEGFEARAREIKDPQYPK